MTNDTVVSVPGDGRVAGKAGPARHSDHAPRLVHGCVPAHHQHQVNNNNKIDQTNVNL